MSGWMTVACRTNDGTKYVVEAHSRNAHDIYVTDLSFLDGDDSGALRYINWHRDEIKSDVSEKAIRENEYGVLLMDFVQKEIVFNRDSFAIERQSMFVPKKYAHDRDMGNAGRITLVCPEGSVEPLKITPEMVGKWESLVNQSVKSFDPEDLRKVPFPRWYYMRHPQPSFVCDYSPWTVRQFNEDTERAEFWGALEASGFKVDQQNWLGDFEDEEDGEQ